MTVKLPSQQKNFERRGAHVYLAKSQGSSDELQSLIEQVEKNTLSSLEKLSLSRQIHPDHIQVLWNAIQTALYLLSKGRTRAPNAGLPLWIELFVGGQSIRHPSRDWLEPLTKIFTALGVLEPRNIVEACYFSGMEIPPDIDPIFLAGYREVAFAESVARLRENPLLEIPTIHLKSIDDQIRIESVRLVEMWRRSKIENFQTRLLEFQDRWIFANQVQPLNPLTIYLAHNAVAFIAMCTGDIGTFLTSNEASRKIADSIEEQSFRSHLQGINLSHRATFKYHAGDIAGALTDYLGAYKLDRGSSEFAFRISSIYHDANSYEANDWYLKALSGSTFDKSLVNDFGIFLRDHSPDRFESWQALIQSIGIYDN